ncbi:hypothetical protein [Methylobacterium sp. J-076]|uniref:hypothetical protein n=1 Tax=Methylobacterium sp. J-076 TaxID=2836655 RepID=UPI001FB9EC6B|nr:hypothetical protein [Methylobacterium sp. J-076]MCJ2012075.1 hypothetical protein [Methylobacterium sp. J-076]
MPLAKSLARVALAAALPLALSAAPALAQVQQGNPNAANESMSSMSTTRSLQQGSTTQNNTTMMNIQRSQSTTPPPAPAPIPRGGSMGR